MNRSLVALLAMFLVCGAGLSARADDAADPKAIVDLKPSARPDADASQHTFQMVKVPDGSDCAYVLAHECELFHP